MKLLAICLGVLSLLAGCKDPYGASSKAAADIAAGITTAMQTTQGLQQQKVISNQEALNVLGYFEFANGADEAFESCIGAAHAGGNQPGTYTACALTFNTALNTPSKLALIKVMSGTASQAITTAVNGLAAATTAIVNALGGA